MKSSRLHLLSCDGLLDLYSPADRHHDRENMMGEPEVLSRFEGENVISLETYRRNGEPVRTPVWFLKENGILYVHTGDNTGKVKRIRRNPKVRVAPSHFRGK